MASPRRERIRADLCLTLVALARGRAFVAQRLGMEQVGPSWRQGIRGVLLDALAWALHAIAVGRFAPGRDAPRLALVQYALRSLLSIPAALVLEPWTWPGLLLAAPGVLYAGVLSIGLGYTGQIVAQRHTSPTHGHHPQHLIPMPPTQSR
ncbi:MAG: DMT family transporter [Anaerolineae bacterium]